MGSHISRLLLLSIVLAIPLGIASTRAKLVSAKDQVGLCGFAPVQDPPVFDARLPLCPDIGVECAENSSDANRFCETIVDTEPGFLLGCAPVSQKQMCAPGSCLVQNGTTKEPRFVKADLCEAVDWSVLVYQTEPEIKEALAALDITRVQIGSTPIGNVQFFHYASKDKQWLVFRGTDFAEICNAFDDAEIALVPSGIVESFRLHHGYYAAAKSAIKSIKLDASKPLHISGHSLGGAVATVTGLLLQHEGYDVASVITFGQPQVTDKLSLFPSRNIVDKLPLLRVINGEDIIPYMFWLLPESQRVADPYSQFGPELRIGINRSNPSQFAYLSLPTGTRKVHLGDHSVCTYQSHISAVAGCSPRVACDF